MLAWYAPWLSCAIEQQKDKIMIFKYRHGRVKAKAKGIVFYFAAYILQQTSADKARYNFLS